MSDYDQDFSEFNSPERDDDYNVFEERQLDLDRAHETEEEFDDEPCRYCGSRDCGCHLQEDQYPDDLEDTVDFMEEGWNADFPAVFANFDADRSGW